jgi:hypothetical protein
MLLIIVPGGYIGPIFGGLEGDGRTASASNNIDNNRVFAGTAFSTTLEMNDCYYTDYIVRGNSSFNTSSSSWSSGAAVPLTTTYRLTGTSINYDMKQFQGVNKGIYTSDMVAMLTMFNNYDSSVKWETVNGEFSLKERLVAEIEETSSGIEINVTDSYAGGPYTYTWYINNNINDGLTGDTYSIPSPILTSRLIKVLVDDGEYFAVVEVFISREPLIEAELEANIWDETISTRIY